MSLAFGKHQLSIPGPSVMPDRVLNAMHRAAPNIYGGEIVELTHEVKQELKALANCSGDVAIYIGNGHAVWEASLCNVFSRGDKALGLVTGRFGANWVTTAQALGVDVTPLEFTYGQPVDYDVLRAALLNDTQHELKAVLTVQTDTATSIRNDIQAIRNVMDETGHPALLMVDCIASFACEPFDMDAMGVDVMVAASQKGLMTPPGIGLMFVGPKFWLGQKLANLNTPYWDCYPRVNTVHFQDNFCGTCPTHHIYGLHEALAMLNEEGKQNTWHRHECMAKIVWAAVDCWGAEGEFSCVIEEPSMRSWAVTAISTPATVAEQLRQWCEKNASVSLGVGLNPKPGGPLLDDLFRIGHMGHLNPPMILGTLASIEAALEALGVKRGSGAIEKAAAVVAHYQ